MGGTAWLSVKKTENSTSYDANCHVIQGGEACLDVGRRGPPVADLGAGG